MASIWKTVGSLINILTIICIISCHRMTHNMKKWRIFIFFCMRSSHALLISLQQQEDPSAYWNVLCLDCFFKALYPFFLDDSCQWSFTTSAPLVELWNICHDLCHCCGVARVGFPKWVHIFVFWMIYRSHQTLSLSCSVCPLCALPLCLCVTTDTPASSSGPSNPEALSTSCLQ